MIVNKRKLADIIGCTEETLSNWQKQGMPILLKRIGREGNEYETSAVISWLDARRQSDAPPTDYDTERTRKVKLEADILGLEKSQLEGKLIPAEKVEQAWIAMASAFRAKILSIPSKYAPQLTGLLSFIEIERILNDAIYAALTELSDASMAEGIAVQFDEDHRNTEAAAEPHSQPVGESKPAPKRRGQRRARAV